MRENCQKLVRTGTLLVLERSRGVNPSGAGFTACLCFVQLVGIGRFQEDWNNVLKIFGKVCIAVTFVERKNA